MNRSVYRRGRLTAKPQQIKDITLSTGLHVISLNAKKDSLLYVPLSYNENTPAPLAVMLHGAGGNAHHGLSYLQHYADTHNIILLAPASREYSWDLIASQGFDHDVVLIDQALLFAFRQLNVDASRLAVGGFSDGASYALSIGLTNGDLFSHIIAFSPGFFYIAENMGKPNIYVSHGTNDDILPIHSCSRRMVPKLQQAGFDVKYDEFEGRHEIPDHISQTAVQWFCCNV
jgi:predicted esterase